MLVHSCNMRTCVSYLTKLIYNPEMQFFSKYHQILVIKHTVVKLGTRFLTD